MKSLLPILLFTFLAIACDQNSVDPPDTGNWLLYERGYSPGAGYITEDVAAIPPQTLTLNADGSMKSSIGELSEYKFYLILEQGDDKNKILAVYKVRPVDQHPDINKLERSYEMAFDEEGNLKLSFRWCFEGCHLGLKRLNH